MRPSPSRGRTRRVWMLAALAAVALAGAGAYLSTRNSTTPVSVKDAVSRFRDGPETRGDPPRSRPATDPEPGVYRYSMRGAERIDAVLDTRRDYPRASTITVSRDGCRVAERVDLVKERWTRWEFCLTAGQRRLQALTEFHEFFGVSVLERYRCSGARIPRASRLAAGFRWTDRCRGRDAGVTARGRVLGVERLTVAGRRVETVHLRYAARASGRIRGTRVIDSWLQRSNGLLARRSERSDVRISGLPTGSARSRERFTMRLRSRRPLG